MSDPKQNVSALRKRLALSQEEFAARAEFSVDTLRKIERGVVKLTLDRAVQIADTYGVSLDYLYGRTEDTADEASTMLLYLLKLFSYKIDEDYEYPYILEISDPIFSFLTDYRQAEMLFNSGKIPEAAFIPWVEKLKSDLNCALKKADAEKHEYCIVPKTNGLRKDAPRVVFSTGARLGGGSFNG